jgi:hypothetical protein
VTSGFLNVVNGNSSMVGDPLLKIVLIQNQTQRGPAHSLAEWMVRFIEVRTNVAATSISSTSEIVEVVSNMSSGPQ